jgi:ATPases of the AAA+ class
MKHTIKVGQGFGKKSFDQAMKMSESGDTIIVEPGTYDFSDGFEIRKDLVITGSTQNAEDVILLTSFYPYEGSKLELYNLLMHNDGSNCVVLREKSQLISSNCVFKGDDLEGNHPNISIGGQSSIELKACSIYSNTDDLDSIWIKEDSKATISGCLVDTITLNKGHLIISQSQIKTSITGTNESEVNSEDMVEYLSSNDNIYAIFVKNSVFKFNEIESPDKDITVNVIDGLLKVKTVTLAESKFCYVKWNDQSTADITGKNVKKINVDDAKREEAAAKRAALLEAANEEKKKKLEESKKPKEPISNNPKPPKTEENPEETETPNPKPEVSDELSIDSEIEGTSNSEEPQESALDQINNLYGLASVKKTIATIISSVDINKKRVAQGMKPLSISLHSLFLGNPGTGKTTVARLLGKALYENGIVKNKNFIEVSRDDLVSDVIGGSEKLTKGFLEKATGGILFIDEAYSLYSTSSNDFGSEVVATLIKYMEDHRDDIMIIFAGYTDKMQNFINMNPGMKSRIPYTFNFEDYTPEEIANMGYDDLVEQQSTVNEDKYKKIVATQYEQSTDQSNARWVRNFNKKLLLIAGERIVAENSSNLSEITDADLDKMLGGNKEEKEKHVKELLQKLDNLTGLNNVKSEVNTLIKEAQVDQKLAENGLSKPSYNMVFEGNPGTGKTTVAEIIGKLFYNLGILPSPIVKTVDRSDLVGMYQGETSVKTKGVLEESVGGVLFVDEAYQLMDDKPGKEAIEAMLTSLENYRGKMVFIFAGYTDLMEKFLDANPGLRSRVQKTITFPDYSEDEIATMVENNLTKKWQVNSKNLDWIVKKIFENEAAKDKQSNGRWARNFVEKLESKQKVYLIDNDVPDDQLKFISDDVLKSVYYDYQNAQEKSN